MAFDPLCLYIDGMKEVARLLGDMLSAEIITDYAVFGAVAQMRYTEAVATMDADVLVVMPHQSSIDVLKPIYEFCAARGYTHEKESIRVGDWPLQIFPVFNTLTSEAVREADSGDIDGVPLRVVRADYLAALALSTGRPKDYARILALLEARAVSTADIENLTARHGLQSEWLKFKKRFLDDG